MIDHTSPDADRTTQEAVAWLVRTGDPDFTDWAPFETWLSAAPGNADAYHAAAAAEAEMVAVLASSSRPIAVERTRRPLGRRAAPWAGAALAASLIAVVTYRTERPVPAPLVYETAPGAQRSITLTDGSRVVLNGGTRLLVDSATQRSLTLARGEALFTVRHDAATPFHVRVGDADVIDVGTRFDMVRDGDSTRVAVSEGAIDWQRGGDAVRVVAGRALHSRDGSPDVALSAAVPGTIGGWSRGQIEYDGASLAEVAGDLSRTLGIAVTVDDAVAHQTMRGVVQLNGGADAVLPRVAALAGVRARRAGNHWRLLASP